MSKNKARVHYVCQNCGVSFVKWQGKCTSCGEWNTLTEELIVDRSRIAAQFNASTIPVLLSEVESAPEPRVILPDQELNRVLDGGIVPGSLILLGGEPGIGKSTLLLQLALQLQDHVVLYVSGEESARQIKMRSERIPIQSNKLFLYPETTLERIFEVILQMLPSLVIIDSIQTVSSDQIDASPGSMVQIRECTNKIMRLAKDTQISFIIIGHINKDGALAGPKVLEHIVDVVLEFEGDRHYNYRILRSSKNRFGSTPELGLFEMRQDGMHPVNNPSELFLSQSSEVFSGVAVAATLQGMRPLLIETQALVSSATFSTPQRSSTGLDLRRLQMLIAVLEKKLEFKMGDKDVFVNFAGGIKMDDPAIDLSIVCAIISSYFELSIPPKTCFAAEVGLTGEVRSVSRIEQRIAEADRLGFEQIFISAQQKYRPEKRLSTTVRACSSLKEVFKMVFQ